MQFIDLAYQQQLIKEQLVTNINNVLTHGSYIMGPEVGVLEERLASFVGTKYAVGCASGTDALLLALMSHKVGPGDAVFTSPFTFIATAEVISLLGATPIFVDIDPVTFNLDPGSLEQAINAVKNNDRSAYPLPKSMGEHQLRPKGIIAVDIFGLPADYQSITSLAKSHNLFLIEDGAQSFGAEYKGRKACSLAEIGCTSFFPAKPLGGYGDGGMCFTDDENLRDLLRSLTLHGKGHHKYDNVRIGVNGRLDTLQAAILLAKFHLFPNEVKLRQEVALRYNDLLGNNSSGITPPAIPESSASAWAQYSVLAKNSKQRGDLQRCLKEQDIPTAIYYPRPLHLQTAFSYLGYEVTAFPISSDITERIFSLPMHPYLKEEDQLKIAEAIRNAT